MGYGDYCSLILLQMCFEPLDTLGVEVVGRFVEEEYIRLFEQETAQCYPTSFSTTEVGDFGICRRALERIHGSFQLGVDFPSSAVFDFLCQLALPLDEFVHLVIAHRLTELEVNLFVFLQDIHNLLNAFLNHFQYGFLRIHLRFLLQVAHAVSRRPNHFALIALLYACYDFHQCGFT